MRKEYMGEFDVGLDQWFAGRPVDLWSDALPVSCFERDVLTALVADL